MNGILRITSPWTWSSNLQNEQRQVSSTAHYLDNNSNNKKMKMKALPSHSQIRMQIIL